MYAIIIVEMGKGCINAWLGYEVFAKMLSKF